MRPVIHRDSQGAKPAGWAIHRGSRLAANRQEMTRETEPTNRGNMDARQCR